MHLPEDLQTSLVPRLVFVATPLLVAYGLYHWLRVAGQQAAEWRVAPLTRALLFSWLFLTAIAGYTGSLRDATALPPPVAPLLAVALGMVLIAVLHPGLRALLRAVPGANWVLLQTLRVPVEIGLFFWYLEGHVPQQMSFAGANFDILVGLTAPLVAWWAWRRSVLPTWVLGLWHIWGLGMVIYVAVMGILSAPSPIQLLNLERPNLAVLYFPGVWLPTFLIPVVLLAHIMGLVQLPLYRRARQPKHHF